MRPQGMKQADWKPLDQAGENLVHTEPELDWLGFETQEVIDAAAAIRRSWSEEECRQRAGVPLGVLFRVLGDGVCYDPVADFGPNKQFKRERETHSVSPAAPPAQRVKLGRTISSRLQ